MRLACKQCDHSFCGYKTGAIAVSNGNIIAQSFNETLKGEKYCQDGHCYREENHLHGGKAIEKVCSIHAEVNLIAEAAKKGTALQGTDIYVTTFPCYICTKSIIKAGFKKVFYMSDYGGNEGLNMLLANGVVVTKLDEKEVWSSVL